MKQTTLKDTGSLSFLPFSFLAFALCLGITSCSQNPNPAATQEQSSDPAQANLAPADQQASEPAPVQQTAPVQQPAPQQSAQSSYAPPQQSYQSQSNAG